MGAETETRPRDNVFAERRPAGSDDAPRRRLMGEQERLLHYLHHFGGLIAVTVLHIRGPLTADLARRGLAWLQRRHPILGAHVRHRRLGLRRRLPFVVIEPELVMEGTLPIPLAADSGGWREAVRREGTRPLPRHGRHPRARALLCAPGADGISRLILTLDHAIADAPAAAMAVRDLMAFFADPRLDAPPRGLPPPLESRYAKPGDANGPYVPAIRLPWRRVRGARRTTEAEWRRLTAAETTAIRNAARAHGTSVHATMTAAFLTGLGERYGLAAVTVLSTVEFRRLATPPLPRDTFGCYIDILRTRHALDRPFWPLATDVGFRLVGTLAREQAQRSILTLPGWPVYRHEGLPMALGGQRLDALAITSAGELAFGRSYGAFTLEDVTLLVSMHTLGPSLFGVGYEWDGALTVGACYAAHTIAAADVAAIVDRTVAILRDLPD
jgi:hypothetical protein